MRCREQVRVGDVRKSAIIARARRVRAALPTEMTHAEPGAGYRRDRATHAAGDGAAFVLGAVAGFVSVLLNRMAGVIERIRNLHEIPDADDARAHLKSDIPRLRRRARLLNSAAHLALLSGLCTAMLIVVGFGSAFFHLHHEYGSGLLFAAALGLLGAAIFRFGQEVRLGLSEADFHR